MRKDYIHKLKRKLFFSILLLAFCFSGFSQINDSSCVPGYGRNWAFGNKFGIEFAEHVIPETVYGRQLCTSEGCANVSDCNGEMLFYTDGTKVWDRNDNVMPNGDSLKGHWSSTQSALVVPFPGSTRFYYIFTTYASDQGVLPGSASPRPLLYNVVDMTLNGGNGDIIAGMKNLLMPTIPDDPTNNFSEKLTATKDNVGTGYWLISHLYSGTNYYSFHITTAGISSPLIQSIGHSFGTDGGYSIVADPRGQLKVSPDGKHLANAINGANVGANTVEFEIMDFDNATANISNHYNIDVPNNNPSGGGHNDPYGVEFSPNAYYLYLSVAGIGRSELWDYSVVGHIITNLTTPLAWKADYPGYNYGALQLGPDGRIYMAMDNTSTLSVINHPDNGFLTCDFQQDAIPLNIYAPDDICTLPGSGVDTFHNIGLPTFIQSDLIHNNITGEITQVDSCVQCCVQFLPPSTATCNLSLVNSYSWDFGDGTTSTEFNPTHTYPEPGDFEVTLVITNLCDTDTLTHLAHIIQCCTTPLFWMEDTSVCMNDTSTIILDGGAFVQFNVNGIAIGPRIPITSHPMIIDKDFAKVSNNFHLGDNEIVATFFNSDTISCSTDTTHLTVRNCVCEALDASLVIVDDTVCETDLMPVVIDGGDFYQLSIDGIIQPLQAFYQHPQVVSVPISLTAGAHQLQIRVFTSDSTQTCSDSSDAKFTVIECTESCHTHACFVVPSTICIQDSNFVIAFSGGNYYQIMIDGIVDDTFSGSPTYNIFNGPIDLVPGVYELCLVASMDSTFMCSDTECVTVTVVDCPCPPQLKAHFNIVVSGNEVRVTDNSPYNPSYVSWYFGDGTPFQDAIAGQPATHAYTHSGKYTICIIANWVDYNGFACCSDTFCIDINVIVRPCDLLDGVVTYFPDSLNPYNMHLNATYNQQPDIQIWNFGDGASVLNNVVSSETTDTIHGYTNPGVYHVCLISLWQHVEDGDSCYTCCADTICMDVSVFGSETYRIYPNPAADIVTVELVNVKSSNVAIRVLNVVGDEVYNRDFKNTNYSYDFKTHIIVGQLTKGLYEIEIKTDTETKTFKIIKE